MKLIGRAAFVAGFLLPLILAALTGYGSGGLHGLMAELWESIAVYMELYGLMAFALLAYWFIVGEEITTQAGFSTFVNSLILVTILAVIHYHPLMILYK